MTADSISNLRRAVATLESQASAQDATQTNILRRLEEVSKSFEERLQSKEDRISLIGEMNRSIQLQNDALQKQLTSRWSFITGMVTFVALAFALNFGYEIFRIKEVMDVKTSLELGSKNLSENALKYSDILNDVSYADTLLTEGNRELLRNAYIDAETLADRAVDRLIKALKTSGFSDIDSLSVITYEEQNCLLASTGPMNLVKQQLEESLRDDRTKNDSNQKSPSLLIEALSPRRLRPVVAESLFNAYDLRAKARFFAGEIAPLRNDGAFLIALSPSRWEGYHWVGIAATRAKADKLAIACYQQSVSRKLNGNKDNINLAEYYFVHGDYPNALIYSEAYLKSVNYRFLSPVEIVAQFYYLISQYLTKNNIKSVEFFHTTLKAIASKNVSDVKLEGTYDSRDLNDYLTGKFFKELKDYQQTVVKLASACLLEVNKCQ
jgi:hypothetical protein